MKAALLMKLLSSVLVCLSLSGAALGDEPPRFEVPATAPGAPFTFIVYGDTRFTEREGVANAQARRALVERIAQEAPAAVLIGGDLVYQGSDPADYATFQRETAAWSQRKIAVFPALGNHEFQGCLRGGNGCLENWWQAFAPLALKPHRWYSVTLASSILALVLDSAAPLKPGSEQRVWFERQIEGAGSGVRFILVVMHYPPVRDPIFPRGYQENEIARYFSRNAGQLHARVIVVGSHVHNYERYSRDGVMYLVSGGGGAKPVPAPRMFGELSHLRTGVNFHYLRFVLANGALTATMVRYDARDPAAWTEPDRFEVKARD